MPLWAADYWGNDTVLQAAAADSVLVANHKLELLHVGMIAIWTVAVVELFNLLQVFKYLNLTT